MDPAKLPIQLDAPVRVYDPSGNEYKIAEAYMQDGFLCLDIVPNEGFTMSREDAEDEHRYCVVCGAILRSDEDDRCACHEPGGRVW